jgi:hypothetical protein
MEPEQENRQKSAAVGLGEALSEDDPIRKFAELTSRIVAGLEAIGAGIKDQEVRLTALEAGFAQLTELAQVLAAELAAANGVAREQGKILARLAGRSGPGRKADLN